MKTFVLTDIPSPYQVELFNEIAAQASVDLSVVYLRNSDPARMWKPAAAHYECRSLDESAFWETAQLVADAELAVFNYYNHRCAQQLIQHRAKTGKPWCFWGERPGLRRPKFAGRLFRKWKLKTLRQSRAPIWGIGEFAVDGYRREFGERRRYFNLPYFSNLNRFEPGITRMHTNERVFLFSGSLIERKGIDLLARAFARLAREVPKVSLKIAGEGPLKESIARMLRPVQERVEFVGFKKWDELPELYALADVLCVPSRYDGWGLVVPEGLASGLPVIATDRMGATLEFVRSGYNGWLIPAGDESSLFDAMRKATALSDSELARLSRQAQQSISEHTLARGAELFVKYAREAMNV